MAHRTVRLMLLGSPPDMVHGAPSHRTHSLHDRIERNYLFSIMYYILNIIKNQVYWEKSAFVIVLVFPVVPNILNIIIIIKHIKHF